MVETKKDYYKEEINKCLKDLKSIKTFYKQIPNLLTFSRAFFAPFVSTMFLTGHPIVGVVSTILLFLTDMVDGKLARKWDVVSKFGADLDAFCDKIMFLGLSVPLMINNPVILLNFIFEGVISLINIVGRINGLDTKTVFSGKVKTCFLLVMLGIGYLVQYLNVPVALLNTMVGLTFVSQGVAIVDYIKEYNRMNNEKKVNNVILESNDKEQETTLVDDKNIVEELKYEKDFLLDSVKQVNELEPLVRKRKK